MDLSSDTEIFHKQIKAQMNGNKDDFSSIQDLDILDLSGLDLENEENWLYEPEQKTNMDYRDWLYGKCDISNSKIHIQDGFIIPSLKSAKAIDTRTFTRPKKRFTRPSIEHFEQLYNSGSDSTEMKSSTDFQRSSNIPSKVDEELESSIPPTKPLYFDLNQPTSLHNFDSFMMNSAELDSFQNMSPPSLVNSLCSSTFANLMENSFIKNDPILREIRDKDFTETALLQDTEAPMFQSITESCSSLNSDTPESFLKKVSFNGTVKRNISSDNNNTIIVQQKSCNSTQNSVDHNATFEVVNSSGGSQSDDHNSTYPINHISIDQSVKKPRNIKMNQSNGNLNGTYRRTPKHSATFRKADLKNNRLSLNLTFELPQDCSLNKSFSKSIENNLNMRKGSTDDLSSTRTKSNTTVILHSDSIEDLKKQYSSTDLCTTDLNRLSYCSEENVNERNTIFKTENNDSNRQVDIKRSPLGSADSLDRMSSLSSSSRGSSKFLNMADIDAIVEMQERSLSQVMSTPKPNVESKKLLENSFHISPIMVDGKEHLSDSELSDEYKSAKSSKISIDNYLKHPTKSLGHPPGNNLKLKTTQRSSYAISTQRPLQAIPNNIRGSQSKLLGQSHGTSNLKTMGTKLKGSYTSLRPISANLPVAPPVGVTTTHATFSRQSTVNVGSKTEVQLDKEKLSGSNMFAKPQIPRSSGLPRPTGIPRPASRIPGPRSSNIRPTSSRTINH